jgi:hypothetical protein
LKELNAPNDVRLYLPRDLTETVKKLKQGNGGQYCCCEVEINGRVFTESIIYYEYLKVVRIYTQDTTERKRADEALQKAYGELDQKVKERTGELTKTNVRLKHESSQGTAPDHGELCRTAWQLDRKRIVRPGEGGIYPPPCNVSLSMLRFRKILRPSDSFHNSPLFSPANLIHCYQIMNQNF